MDAISVADAPGLDAGLCQDANPGDALPEADLVSASNPFAELDDSTSDEREMKSTSRKTEQRPLDRRGCVSGRADAEC